MESIAKRKYQDLFKRSFERLLDLFILEVILKKKEYDTANEMIYPDHFQHFLEEIKSDSNSKNAIIEKDRKSRQCGRGDEHFEGMEVKQIDAIFKQWYIDHPDRKEYKAIFTKFFVSEEEFIKFYSSLTDRRCHYCGISETQIEFLFNNGEISTKRWSTRGRYMEVDRIKPNDEYKIENMVLSCYWCNNAKTDEFSEDEFIMISDSIRTTWNIRLDRHSQKLIPIPVRTNILSL